MKKVNLFLIALFVMISFSSLAETGDGFQKRFEFVRDSKSNDVIQIYDKSLNITGSLRDYVKGYIKWIKDQKVKYNSGVIIDKKYFDEIQLDEESGKLDYDKRIDELLSSINVKELEAATKDVKFNEILDKFELDLKSPDVLKKFSMVANLNKAGYFYRLKVFRKIFRMARGLAVDSFGPAASLTADTLVYFIERVIIKFEMRKRYHQMILLQYLTSNSFEKVGLTEVEWKKTISSIMDSEIHWWEFLEALGLSADWENYGVERLKSIRDRANRRIENNMEKFDRVGEPINLYFNKVVLSNGAEAIYNFHTNFSFFNHKPSLTYRSDKPNKVFRSRIFYELLRIATKFSPIPYTGMVARRFIDSHYIKQTRREGALFGYYEMKGDIQMMEYLKRQNMNPFDALD